VNGEGLQVYAGDLQPYAEGLFMHGDRLSSYAGCLKAYVAGLKESLTNNSRSG
jgi:hypothetical protein